MHTQKNPSPIRFSPRRYVPSVWFFFIFLALAWMLVGCSGTQEGKIILGEDNTWQANLFIPDFPIERVKAIELQAANQDVNLQWAPIDVQTTSSNGWLQLSGTGGLQQIREMLYGRLELGVEPLDPGTSLIMEGKVFSTEHLDITLESNPSTGYVWYADLPAARFIKQEAEPQLVQASNALGGTAHQTFHFRGIGDGTASIRLQYRRPWEAPASQRTVVIQADRLSQLADLSDPVSHEVPIDLPAPLDIHSSELPLSEKLPSVFDWRATGKTTAVRDQGSCGSCWAFASVGVMESAIQIQDGFATDLSEQYLISCNTVSWGCGGGWTAHDYHQSLKRPSEQYAGAVLEQAFPYNARDVPCQGPYQHPYRLSQWQYVGANYAAPTVQEIKTAIYQYGPVESMVCVGSGFTNYRSGTFTQDESSTCQNNGYVNHAVVLVGWDDSRGPNGSWILRNSWGPDWGDKGYMYIDRTVSNIGYYTSYIEYAPQKKIFLPQVQK